MNQTISTNPAIQTAFQKFTAKLSPDIKQRMNGRLERGLQIALENGVTPYTDPQAPNAQRLYKVKSSQPGQPPYLVNLVARSCTCPDHWKGHYCKHRVAAQVFELAGIKAQPAPVQAAIPTNLQQELKVDDEAIIWACLRLQDKTIGVEVLGIERDQVRIQALPTVNAAGKLEPQFPFPDGRSSWSVPASDLFHLRIFHNA